LIESEPIPVFHRIIKEGWLSEEIFVNFLKSAIYNVENLNQEIKPGKISVKFILVSFSKNQ
jgi:hypothetical protein